MIAPQQLLFLFPLSHVLIHEFPTQLQVGNGQFQDYVRPYESSGYLKPDVLQFLIVLVACPPVPDRR